MWDRLASLDLSRLGLHLRYCSVQVRQRFFDGQRIHLATQAFASFQRLLEIVACDLDGE